MENFKLKFNLIPSGAFNNNLRAFFPARRGTISVKTLTSGQSTGAAFAARRQSVSKRTKCGSLTKKIWCNGLKTSSPFAPHATA